MNLYIIESLSLSLSKVFSIAATNINENTGDHIPDSTLKLLVCKMLDEVSKTLHFNKFNFVDFTNCLHFLNNFLSLSLSVSLSLSLSLSLCLSVSLSVSLSLSQI